MTKVDFQARLNSAKRDETRFNAVFMVVFFGTLYANYLLGVWMDEHKPALWIQLVYGAAIVGFIVASIVVALRGDKRRVRKHGLSCPVCQQPLVQTFAQAALATGCCPQCGARLFQPDLNEKLRML